MLTSNCLFVAGGLWKHKTEETVGQAKMSGMYPARNGPGLKTDPKGTPGMKAGTLNAGTETNQRGQETAIGTSIAA